MPSDTCWRLGCGRDPDGELRSKRRSVLVCQEHGERWEQNPRWEEYIPFQEADLDV